MAYTVGFLSQKGGVGKSTLARTLGREIAVNEASVKIADVDIQQGTSFEWMQRRAQAGLEPDVPVQSFAKVQAALAETDRYDVYIVDGAPHAGEQTKLIAKAADLIVLPVGVTFDDLNPSIRLAHELVGKSITSRAGVLFVLMRVPDSQAEVENARTYVSDAGYQVAQGSIPYRTSYGQAMDQGRALTEVAHPNLKARADEAMQSIIDCLSNMASKEAA